jgi:putative RecB family exonuclease
MGGVWRMGAAPFPFERRKTMQLEQESRIMPTLQQIRESLHISHSQINQYMLCPLKFYFQYVQGIQPDYVPSALVFGSVIHDALATFYMSIISTHETPRKEELTECFAIYWDMRRKRKEEVKFKAKESWDYLLDLGTKMMEAYYDWLNEQGMPEADDIIAVEQPFQVSIGEMDFVGVVDLILRDKKEKHVFHIIDHKTAARRYDEMKIITDNQMSAYKFLVDSSGYLPEGSEITLNFDVLLKTKEPKVERYSTVRDDKAVGRFVKTVHTILSAIDHDIYYPLSSWVCGDCAFKAYCERW